MFRVVVLISGSGSNLQALIDDRQGYDISAVVVDRSRAGGIQRALRADLPTLVVPLRQAKDAAVRARWEEQVAAVIRPFEPDLLVMAGWMRVMSPAFIAQFEGQIINQHPAILPADAGEVVTTKEGVTIPAIRGAHAVRDALRLKLPVTGCTIHQVTAAVDVGPILEQREVPIEDGDTEEMLHERIKAIENPLIVAVVQRLAGMSEEHHVVHE